MVKYIFLYLLHVFLLVFLVYFVATILFFSVNRWNSDVTKYTLNQYFPTENRLNTYLLDTRNIHNVQFPCVIKPTICSGTNKRVSLINSRDELNRYLSDIAPDDDTYIIQEFYKANYEIGVLYEKIPFLNEGDIVSVVLKKSDSHWKPLKCGNIMNTENVECIDMTNNLRNTKFADVIRKISSQIHGFNAGRYDIGFENIEDLEKGRFKIYELNGVMGYDLRANLHGGENMYDTIKKYYYMFRWVVVRCFIGLINVVTLQISPLDFLRNYKNSIHNYVKCSDWEYLFSSSPA